MLTSRWENRRVLSKTDLFERTLAAQFFAEEDRVDLRAALAHRDHGAEEMIVGADVEVFGL